MSHNETPRQALARFDPLPFPARTRAIAEHTRSLDEPAYRALRTALDHSTDPDDRLSGLFLAVVRRDLAAVTAALDDPLLRRRALSAAIRLPVPDTALERCGLSELRAVRRDTFRVLRLGRRRRLAEHLLPEIRRRYGDAEAAALLPACASEAAERLLPLTGAPPGVLAALARTAPRAVAAHLADRRAACADDREVGDLRRRSARLVTTLAESDPRAALLLAERAPELVTERATAVLLRLPRELLAAVGTAEGTRLPMRPGPLPRAAARAVRTLDPGELVRLAGICFCRPVRRLMDHEVAPEPLIALLPAAERRRIVEQRMAASGAAPVHALAALDPRDRVELVRPRLPRGGGGQPHRTAVWATALPLSVSEPLLRRVTDGHRVPERAFAWPALLVSARLEGDPAAYARIVTSCERAWHDQDMVRRAALAQAARAPRRLLDAVPYEALREAATTTTQSRDSSPGTVEAAERWLRATVESASARGDGERAAAVALLLTDLLTAARRPGTPAALRVDAAGAASIGNAAGEPGTDGPRGQRASRLIVLAGLLARHLAALPALDRALWGLATGGGDPALAARAAEVWLSDPATRESRVAELLAADASSAVRVPLVWAVVATRRTDLLDRLLPAAAGTDPAAPPVPRVPYQVTGRWLPAQRAAFARYLTAVAGDEEVPLHERADAAAQVRDRAALSGLVEDAPQPVAAAALTALGECAAADPHDPGPALGLLLDHAATGGVRGRAAMAGLRRLLDALPDTEAIAHLAAVAGDPAAPVGSRKEAARALAELPGERAADALVAAWDTPGQHRDVYAALARPLVARIATPAVFERLTAKSDLPAVLEAVLGAARDGVPDPARPDYCRFLALLVRDGEERAARTAAGVLLTMPRTRVREVAGPLETAAADPQRPTAVRQQAGLVIGGTAGFRRVLDTLVARARTGPDDELLDALRLMDFWQNRSTGGGTHDMLADAFLALGLRRAAAHSAWHVLTAAVRTGRLSPAMVTRMLPLLGHCPFEAIDVGPLHARTPAFLPALPAVLAALRETPGPAAGLLRLVLVSTAGAETGWAEPWPAELAELRGHPDPDVAEAALFARARRRE